MKNVVFLFVFCLSYSSFAQDGKTTQKEAINLLVVTGGPTLRHQLDLVPTSFYSLFLGEENIIWDHATQDEAAFQIDSLQKYDAILMYNRSDTLSVKSKQNLERYLNSGKGMIVLHHALGSYNNWEWWWKEVVGGKYQMKDENGFSKSDYKLGEKITMVVEKEHPINKNIGNFEFVDEVYKNLWLSEEIDIIYKTDNPKSDGPTAWISPFKASKVLVIQPGHAKAAHLDANYKKLVLNAIKWVSD